MRLWHVDLLKYLDDRRLLAQHRECCALRGKSWGKKHSTIDYVFNYDFKYLVVYHWYVMMIMDERGYKADMVWWLANYRGKNCPKNDCKIEVEDHYLRFKEHDDAYLRLCVDKLKEKNAKLKISYEELEDKIAKDELRPYYLKVRRDND